MQEITISDSAVARINQLLTKEKPNSVFRITVLSGGCSGFQYKFDFSEQAAEDLVVTKNGATVVIDPTSLSMLEGSQLEYITELGSQYFVMQNPNASSTCGCGASFAV